MTKYVKGKDGKFQGSIGSGKTRTPQAAPALPKLPPAPAGAPFKAYGPDERISCRFKSENGQEIAELIARANDSVAFAVVTTENFGGGRSLAVIQMGEHRTQVDARHFIGRAHGLAWASKRILELVGLPAREDDAPVTKGAPKPSAELTQRLRAFLDRAELDLTESDWVDKTTAFVALDLSEGMLRSVITADLDDGDDAIWSASVEAVADETGVYYELDSDEFFSKEEAADWARREMLARFREKTAYEFRYMMDGTNARKARLAMIEKLGPEFFQRRAAGEPERYEYGFGQRSAAVEDAGDVVTVSVTRRDWIRDRDVIVHQTIFEALDEAIDFAQEMVLLGR